MSELYESVLTQVALALKAWDESKHPRDAHGRWTSRGVHETGELLLRDTAAGTVIGAGAGGAVGATVGGVSAYRAAQRTPLEKQTLPRSVAEALREAMRRNQHQREALYAEALSRALRGEKVSPEVRFTRPPTVMTDAAVRDLPPKTLGELLE